MTTQTVQIREYLSQHRICVVVPTYNNASTIADVLRRIAPYAERIILVIDGSTDDTREQVMQSGVRVDLIDYPQNRGKGYALKQGFMRAIHQGFEYAITIDSDGQHFPEDIPVFVEAHRQHPKALIVGSRNLQQDNMPGRNTFANKFSNFWFRLQTGVNLPDTQTGYRLYPLRELSATKVQTARYEAELSVLVFLAWSSVKLVPVPVRVYYAPEGERISHFRPVVDFARISALNVLLCVMAVVYGRPRMLIHRMKNGASYDSSAISHCPNIETDKSEKKISL
jgi:glycosyltransferase involved in cell wall biosynthesis